MQNMSEIKNLVESLLFSSGKRLTVEELSKITKHETSEIKQALENLKKELEEKHGSLELVEEGGGYKLTVKSKYVPVVKKVLTAPEIPKSILETLAVAAYKAPVLQSEVIKIRTNKAYDHLSQLEKLGYITREKKGRTKRIKLSPKFFDYFDLTPEKLKKRFESITELEREIEQKEQAIEQTQEQIAKLAKEKPKKEFVKTEGGKEEVYESLKSEKEESLGGLEPAKIGELEVYYPEKKEKKPKKKRKKKKEKPEEEKEEPAAEIARKILGEEKPEAEEEEAEKIREEGRLTLEKIREEAREEKPPETEYEAKGLFPEGMPEEVEERVERRVREIVGSETTPKEEAEETEKSKAEEKKEKPESEEEGEEERA